MKTIKIITAITLFFISFASSSQIKNAPRETKNYKTGKPYQNIFCNGGNVHDNFRDIVDWVNQSNKSTYYNYLVQVTTVNPGRERNGSNIPTHYFTAWSQGNSEPLGDECAILIFKQMTYFSDRNKFSGNPDIVSYSFDPGANSVEVTLHSWGNVKTVYRNLKRVKNTIYHVGRDGSMLVFNLFKQRGPRIR
ncbi:hypothetical protein [Flagellimonas pacifica]|uniref:Uncharacterized protein n=1 Tax=Flagellimonas pacifica TaxID=1247520 RepID=A0A285MSZ3_9FLAO|nr:hypothetical protein [Allomuricauda parva]SNY99657.1 hypothetical protein SAMN06265377_1468 [Allomuricauda parva]